ncbi:tubulin-specific chaperone E [Thrips palmi]|uniref:Tubulin-specific chaperone E n=1 Tax=Thrips palmi TaxID=161013 RepID=A0A6P8Z2Z6_THRPL|nr:tubulin-specific chaperone E [Thrips palmi]
MCTSGDQSEPSLGQRVDYQGYRGTIRFVGEIQNQPGTWVGVEWDDPSRGKHDGSHNGVSYFKTSHPTSGSFVRSTKLNFGISCVDAIHQRYGKVEGSTAGVDSDAIFELKKQFNIPFVEMVGFEKVNSQQSQFNNLTVVDLGGDLVKNAGEEGELGQLCPSVRELVLTNTLIKDWRTVADITKQLAALNHLNVSENKVVVPTEEEALQLQSAFRALKRIVLNGVGCTWKEILICATMWPDVTTVSARFNRINELESPHFGVLSNLTSLYLQSNPIVDWTHVNKLGNLLSLQVLHVGETGLKKVFFPGEGTTSLFPALIELNLQSNEIDDWNSINELNKLKSLQSILFQSNPLMEKPKAFELIIGRIKCLKKLNGTVILDQDRRGAEYDYMKCYGREWVAAVNNPVLLRVFHSNHPRYAELVEKHGSITEEDITANPAPLKARLIKVRIFCPGNANMPEFQKRVPKNMTVQKLNGLVQKLMDTGGCMPSLKAISAKAPDIAVSLEKDMQDLSFYSVDDGDSIAVSW